MMQIEYIFKICFKINQVVVIRKRNYFNDLFLSLHNCQIMKGGNNMEWVTEPATYSDGGIEPQGCILDCDLCLLVFSK